MIEAPTTDEFKRGFMAFQAKEKRDAMYKTATFLVGHFWGNAGDVANSLGVLLLTWNQAFYRYGPFDFDKLEEAITLNQRQLDVFRARDISTYSPADDQAIEALFDTFLGALQLCEGTKKGTSSPVAVAKALHLLAPRFFPLWDAKIATKYGCPYSRGPAEKYILFLRKTQKLADQLAGAVVADEGGKSLIKLIDEYNYAKYTKGWIS